MASPEHLNVASNDQKVPKAVALRNFFARVHEKGETWDEYACVLRALSEPCEFGDMKEALIRNRFVSGITDESLRHLQYLEQAGFCTSLQEKNAPAEVTGMAQKATNMSENISQRKALKEHSLLEQRFKKTPGAADGAGEEFEWQMLTLVYLRLLDSGSEFYIGSNMAAAGLFDDIVVKYRADSEQPWSTAMLQLKHKKNNDLGESALLALNKEFSLVKYCDSYCKMKSSKDGDLEFLGEFCNHQFIIFTNSCIRVKENLVKEKVEDKTFGTGGKVVSFVQEPEFLQQLNEWFDLKLIFGQLKDQVKDLEDAGLKSKVNEVLSGLPKFKNKAVNSTIQLLSNNPTIKILEKILESLPSVEENEPYVEFLGNLNVYTKQADGTKLGIKIKQGIANTFGFTATSVIDCLFNELIDNIKWWWRTKNTFLTQDSRIWLDIIKTLISKLSESKRDELNLYNVHFVDTTINTICEEIPLEIGGIFNIHVNSRTTASSIKVMAALDRFGNEENILFVDVATLLHREEEVLGFWSSRWCRVLVVECDTELDQRDLGRLSNKIINVIEGKLENKLLVLIGQESNGLTETLDNLNGYRCHRDSCKWSDLTEDSRDNLLYVEVNLQGVKITLKALITTNVKRFATHVNGDVISQLLRSETRCGKELNIVGENFIPRRLRAPDGKVFPVNSVSDVNQKVVLVVAEPGMGKSTLITHLAHSAKTEDPKAWIVHVKLNDCTQHLATMDLENFNSNAAKKLMEKTSLSPGNSLDVALFRSLEENLIVSVDGVDEVCPQYEKQVLQFLRNVATLNIKQLWVTSRPIMQQKLESVLSVKAFDLEPFSQEDQSEFFITAWKLKFPDTDSVNVETYTERLIQEMEAKLGASNPIWEVPLMASMLSDIFEEDLRLFLLRDTLDVRIILDIMSLFDTFMEKKCDIYYTEKKKMDQETRIQAANIDDEESLKQMFHRNHRLAALRFILNVEQLSALKIQGKTEFETNLNTFLDDVRSGREKRGIIDNVSDDGKPHFVHRTFAEYFVASWLSDNFRDNNEFVEQITFGVEYTWIRDLFGHFLTKGHALHTAVLNQDTQKVFNLLSDESTVSVKICNAVDRGGRTPLHLAVLLGGKEPRHAILQLLLQHKARVDFADKVLGWRPLQYADRGQAWTAAGMILAAGGNEEDMPTIMSIKQPLREGFIAFIKKPLTTAPDASLMLAAARDAGLSVVRYLVEERRGDVQCRGPRGESMLHMTAEGGDVELLEYLFTLETPLHDKDSDHATPLHYAGRQGNTDAVRFLLERGMDVDAVDGHGETCLQIAARRGDYDVMELLVDKGAEYEVIEGSILNEELRNVCLLSAAFAGSLKSVRLLVKMGASIDHQDAKGATAKDIATRRRHSSIVQFLSTCGSHGSNIMIPDCIRGEHERYVLAKGSFIQSNDANGCPALWIASYDGNLEDVKCLVENGASMVGDMDGDTALHLAAMAGKVEVVSYLLDHLEDINAVNKKGPTALSLASFNRHLEVVKVLVENEDCIVCHEKGDSPLHWAARAGKLDVVLFLLQHVKNINVLNKLGRTSLALASRNDHLEVVKLLVEKGATMVGDKNGDTPLHLAAYEGNINVVKYLLEDVNTINIANKKGLTALSFAACNGKLDVVKLLVEKEASMVGDKDGDTPLHFASREGRAEVVSFLLKHVEDVKLVNNFGQRAIDLAMRYGHNEVVQFIFQAGGMTLLDYLSF